jgi:hypothetical protein
MCKEFSSLWRQAIIKKFAAFNVIVTDFQELHLTL